MVRARPDGTLLWHSILVQEHEYALRVCIERYLSSVVPDGVQGGGRGVISPAVAALRAKHIDDKAGRRGSSGQILF